MASTRKFPRKRLETGWKNNRFHISRYSDDGSAGEKRAEKVGRGIGGKIAGAVVGAFAKGRSARYLGYWY
ncbi:hypothetical protein AAFN47_23885 [Hoeflea sp. CAU 1731]